MSKKYSIGFLIGAVLIIALLVVADRMSYSRSLDKHNADVEKEKEVQAELETCYYIKDTEGYVTVYKGDKTTVFEYTSILVTELPEHLQEDLKEGLKVTSLGQVYGFLENYSS